VRPPGIFTKQRKAVQNALAVRQVEMAAVVPADHLLPERHVPAAAIIRIPSDGKDQPRLGLVEKKIKNGEDRNVLFSPFFHRKFDQVTEYLRIFEAKF
jgi:hypothetical protein